MKLTQLEDGWAQAALGAMFPGSRDKGLAGIGGMDVHGFLADVMRSLPFKAAIGLRAAVWLVALAPIVVLRRLATIRSLPPVDRERVVASLSASRTYVVRSLTMVLKAIGALLYAGDEAVRARLHFQAPVAGARLAMAAPSLVPLRAKRSRSHVA